MDIKETELDFESMKEKPLRQLRSGESLYGKDGAFAPLLKKFLEAALDAEMDAHLDEPERLRGNRRNGKQHKRLRTSDGTIELSTPRDRHSSYDPQLVKKRETILADLRKNPYRVSDYGTAVK